MAKKRSVTAGKRKIEQFLPPRPGTTLVLSGGTASLHNDIGGRTGASTVARRMVTFADWYR